MNEEFLAEIATLRHYAAGLHELITEAQRQKPARAEGSDPTGSVHVVLGRDELPESIRVDSGWARKLEPGAFGAAVLQAAQAATGARMAEWTRTLQEDGWQARAEGLRRTPERAAPAGMPPALRGKIAEARPRPLGDLAEEMIKAFDRADQVQARPPAPASGVGEAAAGKLRITLTAAGLASCAADPRWVAEQSPARLMNALNEAMSAARSRLASAAPEQQGPPGLDGLLAEALSVLGDPQRFAGP